MASEIADRLRRALEAGDFVTAQPLILEYSNAIRSQLTAHTSPNERESIWSEALQTLQQFICLTRAMRSHLCVRLQAISGQAIYHAPGRQMYTWRING